MKITSGIGTLKNGIVSLISAFMGISSSSTSIMTLFTNPTAFAVSGMSLAPIIAGVAALTAVVAGAYAIYDKFINVTDQESFEELSEMKSDFDNNKAELEKLNSELETTSSRIDELNTKKHLSFTEKQELKNLQAQRSELERIQKIKENENKIDAKNLAAQSEETYNKWTNDESLSYDKNKIDYYQKQGFSLYGKDAASQIENSLDGNLDFLYAFSGLGLNAIDWKSNSDNINYLIGTYVGLGQAKDEINEKLNNLIGDGIDPGEQILINSLENYKQNIETKIGEADKYINSYASVMSEIYSSLLEGKELGVLTKDQEVMMTTIEKFLDTYEVNMGETYKGFQNSINNIFSKAEFIDLESQLVEAGEQGEDALRGMINENEAFSEALKNSGVDIDEFVDHIMSIADPDAYDFDFIKEKLKETFTSNEDNSEEIFDNFISDKSYAQVSKFYDYVKNNNLDISLWNEQDLEANFNKAQEKAELFSETFKNIISTEKESDNLSDFVDNFVSKMNTLNEVSKQINSGEFSVSSIYDIIKDIPSLSGNVEDLDMLKNSLKDLSIENLREFAKGYHTYIEGITDEEERSKAVSYMQSMINQWDLTGFDLPKKNELSKLIFDNINVNNEDTSKGISGYLYKVIDDFGGTKEGIDAIIKLSLNPDAAQWTYDEWVSKIEDTVVVTKLNITSDNISSLERDLAKKDAEISSKKAEYDSTGRSYGASYYEDRISESVERQGILSGIVSERENYYSSLKDAPFAGAEEINNAYIALENAKADYWEEVKNQFELENEQDLISINKLKTEIEGLQTEADVLNDKISLKEAKGYSATESDYKGLISNSVSQVSKMEEEIAKYEQLQQDWLSQGFSEDDDIYIGYQEEIDSLNASIRQNTIDQIEWNNAIKNIPLDNLKAASDLLESKSNIKTAEYDSREITYDDEYYDYQAGILDEEYKNLVKTRASKIKKYERTKNDGDASQADIDVALTEANNAHADVLDNVAKQNQNETDKAKSAITLLKNELQEINNEATTLNEKLSLKEAKGLKLTASDYADLIKNSEESITKNEELRKQLEKDQENWLAGDPNRKVTDATYLDYQDQIMECDAAINQATIDQIEWNNEIANLPIHKLNNELQDLQTEADKVNSSLSMKEAKGIKPVVSDYQKLISNSRDQVKNLQQQNAELKNQQDNLIKLYGQEVVNGDEYRNIQQQIEENVQTIDEARLSQDEWNESAKQLFNQKNEGLLAYDAAKSTRNAGDNYLDMLEAAKEAQEAREKGLVGTDDYKAVAKMFSPNGMDDYLNWDENYGKIQKYFTEDVSGVKKFLDDLSNKTNDAGESLASFDSETGTWTYNIDNVADSANKLGISFEAFLAIMGRLQDYGFTNDYFSSVEEGYDHIADLTMDLYEAQSKLSDLQDKKANGDETVTDAVLSQQEARINQIKQSILDSQALLSEVANRSAEQFQQQQMANITSTAQMLEQARTYKFDNEEIRKAYINDIKDRALDAGVEIPAEVFIDEYTIDENALQKWAEENETTLTPSYEMKDAETSGIKDKLTQMFEDESSSAKAIVDELSSYTEEQLSGITFGDSITDGTLPEAEGLIDKLLTQLGLGQSEAQTLIHILAELGYIEPKVEFEASTESVDTAAQEIENTPVKKVVNFVQGGISSIKQAIQSKFAPESKTVETNNVTNNTVNTSINTVNPEEPVQKAQEYANANPVNVTTQVQVTGSTETNVNGTGIITVDGNNENAKASVDAAVGYAKSQNPVMNIRGNSSLARSSADNASSYISSLSPSISINAKTNGISNAISNALNGPFSINVSARVNGIHGLSRATGTAYAGGSAVYDKWTDYRHSVGAYANGTSKNWALPNDEEALVNELGTESIVRNGRWFTIPGGAHVEQLKKNDIIFNVKQTEELIKYGKVLSGGGHGRIAHADGTAYNMIKAYAKTPTNSGSFVGSSSSSSATTQNTNAVRQNTNAQKQNTKTTKNSITSFDKFKKWLEKLKDWVEVRIQRLNDTISLNTAKSENQIGYANKNKKLDVVGSTYKKLYDNQISGAKEYEAQAGRVATNAINAKMLNGKTKADRTKRANDLIKLIKEGKINIAEYGEKEREFIQTYSEWWDKAVDLRLSAEETLKNQRDNEKQKFDNIVSEYDNLLSAIEHKANMIKQYQTLNETRGYVDSTKYFERLSAIETQNQKKLEEERSKLVAQLQQSMNSGVIKYGDERWYEMQNQINGVSEAILESATNVAELANSIRQLNWEKFDYGRDMVNRLNDEFDFMIDIMSDEEMFGKDGKITSAGLSTLAMHGSKYNVYMEQANEYAREYKKIEKELAKDPYNKTLIDRKQELIDKQRESIQAAEDEKQSMISLVEDGIDAELNALQELIDKYTESLDKAKDLYDYRNSIADQTSEISKYQKQVNAYANDMSEEGRLKYQKAQNSLKDAQKNLRESEYDRYISDQKDMLSELYDDYETILNERLTNIDELISTVITSANENKSEIVTTLQEQAAAVGYVFTDEFTKIWGENGSSAKVLSDYTSDFSNRATLLQTSIDGILGFVQKMYDTSNQNANRDISSSSSSSVDPQVTRTTTTTTSSSSSSSSNSSKPSTSQSSSTTEEKLGPVSGISGTLKKGAKNANVGELQKALKKMGYKDQYGKALIVDKWFGPKTQAALKKFQKKMGIPQTGILDAKTKAAFKKKGYARGTDWIDKDELALTQERGTEIITLPDGGMITPLKRGSGVINNPNTEKVLSLAANHDLIMDVITESHKLLSADQTSKIASAVQKIGNSAINHTYGGETAYYINNEFHLEKVQKPEEFMNWMIHDAKAQNALCDMTLAKISGKTNSFATRNKF